MVQKFKNLLVLLSGVLFLSSFMYLYGYWNALGVNVFEFVAIADLVRFAIVPLIISYCISLLFFVISLMVGAIAYLGGERVTVKVSDDINKLGDICDNETALKFSAYISLVILMMTLLFWGLTINRLFLYAIISFVLVLAFVSFFKERNIPVVSELTNNTVFQKLIIFPIVACLFFSFPFGIYKAESLSENGHVFESESYKTGLIYAGVLGDYFALLNKSKGQVELVRREKITSFVVKLKKNI